MRMVRTLGREDWIEAGLEALARGGPRAFAIEPVARALRVSKGSFYWHFSSRADWRDAVLAWWEHRQYLGLVRVGRHARQVARQDRTAEGARAGDPSDSPRTAVHRQEPAGHTANTNHRQEASLFPELLAALQHWAQDDAAVARSLHRIAVERRRAPVPMSAPQGLGALRGSGGAHAGAEAWALPQTRPASGTLAMAVP